MGKFLIGLSFMSILTIYLNLWPTNTAYFVAASVIPTFLFGLGWEMTHGSKRDS